jgi:hypothetical protein
LNPLAAGITRPFLNFSPSSLSLFLKTTLSDGTREAFV